MDRLKIRLTGKVDARGCDYYFSTTKVPVSIDLSNSVLLFFPDEDPDNPENIGGDLIIKHYDKRQQSVQTENPNRVGRRRRPSKAKEPDTSDTDDTDE